MHLINFKRALNQELVLKKGGIVIKLNQKTCLKPCNDVNTKLKKCKK